MWILSFLSWGQDDLVRILIANSQLGSRWSDNENSQCEFSTGSGWMTWWEFSLRILSWDKLGSGWPGMARWEFWVRILSWVRMDDLVRILNANSQLGQDGWPAWWEFSMRILSNSQLGSGWLGESSQCEFLAGVKHSGWMTWWEFSMRILSWGQDDLVRILSANSQLGWGWAS